jgi:hypothetical protein
MRVVLSGQPGETHSAYFADDGMLVVEWYDHREDGPYESATMLHFDGDQQRALARALGVAFGDGEEGRSRLLEHLAARFRDYFSLSDFAQSQGLNPAKVVDFNP